MEKSDDVGHAFGRARARRGARCERAIASSASSAAARVDGVSLRRHAEILGEARHEPPPLRAEASGGVQAIVTVIHSAAERQRRRARRSREASGASNRARGSAARSSRIRCLRFDQRPRGTLRRGASNARVLQGLGSGAPRVPCGPPDDANTEAFGRMTHTVDESLRGQRLGNSVEQEQARIASGRRAVHWRPPARCSRRR